MAQMIGADVDSLRRLASQFDHSAQRLRALSGQVSNGLHVAGWLGPVAVRFRVSWDSEHSLKLKNAAAALDTNARALRQNADAQETTSSADLSWRGRSIAGMVGGLDGLIPPWLPFPRLPEFPPAVSGMDGPGIRLPDGRVLPLPRNIFPPEFTFPSPMTPDFIDEWGKTYKDFWSSIDDAIPGFAGLSPKDMINAATNVGNLVGAKVPMIGAVMKVGDYGDLIGRTVSGDFRASEWISKGGEALMSVPNPAVKLAGLNVQMWTMVGEEAAKGDFSPHAMKQTADYAVAHLDEAAAEVGRAAVQVGVKFFNMFK